MFRTWRFFRGITGCENSEAAICVDPVYTVGYKKHSAAYLPQLSVNCCKMPYFTKSGHYDNFPTDGCKVSISEGDRPFSKSQACTF